MLGRGGFGSELITGVVLRQTRRAATPACGRRFSKLHLACTLATLLPASYFDGNALRPYGREQAFHPSMPQYQPDLQGAEATYFNTSAGSPEVGPTGFPYLFFARQMRGLRRTHDGFPVVFEVRVNSSGTVLASAMLGAEGLAEVQCSVDLDL
jgi:hypothetical protein